MARNTVRAALRSGDAPQYTREGPGSAVDAFEPAIRRLLATTPDMPATVVAERIGWTRGITVLRERVGELRPAYQVPEAFGRTEYKAGELAQWDLWFPDYDIPVGHGQTAVLPVLVGVACYSRWLAAAAIDLIVYITKTPQGRVVTSVRQVTGFDGTQVVTNELYRPGRDRRGRPNMPIPGELLDELVEAGYDPALHDNPEGWWR